MKKIDFHIHTVATSADAAFEYDLAKLIEYVETMDIDGIAVTNHNIFDKQQYESISNSVSAVVLPGIEINLGKGHALLISDAGDIDDFTTKCSKVRQHIQSPGDTIDVNKLREIFGDLSSYLVIPHYDKHKSVDEGTLEQLGDDFYVGEVASAKKFMYMLQNPNSPSPVLFSDARANNDWDFKSRQTYIDVTNIDVRSIKLCLQDKSKLALARADGNKLIEVTPSGITVSSGLTVVLGGRSSGKSHTLDEIYKYNDNVKYIEQFDLIEKDPEKEAEKFNERMGKRQQEYGDKYLRRFRDVVDEIKHISLKNDDGKIEKYTNSLLKYASNAEQHDQYSKTAMFSETELNIEYSDKLKSLIDATQALLTPGKYEGLIESEVGRDKLIKLWEKLIDKYREEYLNRAKREWTNNVTKSLKHSLNSLSAVSAIEDVNLLEVARNRAKVRKFTMIAKELRKPRTIARNQVGKFTIVQRGTAIKQALDLKRISGTVASFREAFANYDDPYEFLVTLMEIDNIDPATYYKFFTKIEYKILNEYSVAVSGGERAEFKLVNQIDGASNFDMLLIDEPESSFDNIFLSSDVNRTIKEIAKHTPVVVVTHNNTVGASIKPDYLIYTDRTIIEGATPEYSVYFGRATDKELISSNGEKISNSEVTLKYLEAGKTLYQERSKMYELLEDR